MTDQIRVGVVGAGSVARAVHLPLLTKRRDLFSIAALCDLSPAALDLAGDRFGVPAGSRFPTVEQLLANAGVDALLVLTSGSHAPVTIEALTHGLAVFSEKPLAYTLAEIEAVSEAIGHRSDRLMVGYMKQYDPAVVRAASLTPDRPRPRTIEVTVLHPSTPSQLAVSEMGPPSPTDTSAADVSRLAADNRELEKQALGAAADSLGPLYSGILLGSLVHDLAVMRSLGVTIETIDHAERWPTDTFPPSFAVLGRSSDGVRISMRWHYLEDYPAYREEVRWHDEDGSVELVFPSPYLLHAPTDLIVTSASGDGADRKLFRSPVEAFDEELVAFHAMVTEGRTPRSGADASRQDVITCQQIAVSLAHAEGLTLGGEAARAHPHP